MKNVVTIFSQARDVHLSKDVGQVINYLAMDEKYNASLVTYKNDDVYPQAHNEAKNINVIFIRNLGSIFNIEFGVIHYLLNNSKNVHILNLYGNRISNLIYILIYKLMYKNGYSYIKMDDDIIAYISKNRGTFIHNIREVVYRYLSKYVNLYSIETKKSFKYINENYKHLKHKIAYFPNSVNDVYLRDKVNIRSYEEKENIILVVGRIGARQKNHELLLNALSTIELGVWRVIFIGGIEPGFDQYIEKYIAQSSKNKEKILFLGEVSNRDELYEWYNRAKIFCLPSRYENFSIACVEALYFGNWIIATRMTSTEELLDNGRLGELFESGDVTELSEKIKKSIAPDFLNEILRKSINEYAAKNYCWSKNIELIKAFLS